MLHLSLSKAIGLMPLAEFRNAFKNLPISNVVSAKATQLDLFKVVFDGLSPYGFGILKLALAATLYSNSIKIIRAKRGSSLNGNNPYSGATTAFLGYLTGRGIPIIVKMSDKICDNILETMANK